MSWCPSGSETMLGLERERTEHIIILVTNRRFISYLIHILDTCSSCMAASYVQLDAVLLVDLKGIDQASLV